jgi:Spy/CpxP family protein refolding chaperone
MKKHLHRLAKKLDLTSEQRNEIKAIYVAMKEDRKADEKSLSSFKEQMNSLLKAGKFDETKFSVIYDKYQKNFKMVAMEKAKRRHAILQVLTPEQQTKYLTMRKHR